MYKFIMPDAGEGTYESEILEWFVKPGDEVEEDQTLMEIQSDKAVTEIPSPVSGKVVKLYAEVGEMAITGEPIIDFDIGDGEVNESTEDSADTIEDKSNKYTNEKSESDEQKTSQTKKSYSDDIRTLAVPRVRIYAREKDIDLNKVKGTGNHGKVTKEDIDKYIKEGPTEDTTSSDINDIASEEKVIASDQHVKPYQPTEETSKTDRVEKLKPMRKIIANAMVESRHISPHVTVFDQVEVEKLVEHRNSLKEIAKEQGIKLTYSAYFVKAIVAMLKEFPELNASINLDKGEMYYHKYYNIGVAANTSQGLYVPMIKNAESKSLFEIAKEITELAEKAQDGSLTQEDMKPGSMTLTNVGGAATSGVWSTPIINQPEVAILGTGRIDEVFLPDEDKKPVLKPVLKLSLAFDHRAIDGVTAQLALNKIKESLNNPNLLLAKG